MNERHWQLTSIFHGVDQTDYQGARAEIRSRLERLEALVAERALGAGSALAPERGEVTLAERVVEGLNLLDDLMDTVSTYLTGFTDVNAFDDVAQAESSSLRQDDGRRGAVEARVTAWLGRFDPERLIDASPTLRDHAHFVRRAAVWARHQMGDETEELAATLDTSGGAAWEQLYDDLIARETISLRRPDRDEPDELGVAGLMNLQADPARAVRAAAHAAEVELLGRFGIVHAAAMNGIKGQVGALAERRGWRDPLEQATFQQGISPEVLAAMQEAVEEAFPVMRRYLGLKARLLGLPRLAWYDLRAPLPQAADMRFTWEEGSALVAEHFDAFSPELAAFARRTYAEGWIDVPPRRGKVSGAFCASAPLAGESRIMLNWGDTLDDVSTLAHELGHGYHNDCRHRFGRTALQSRTPMTLAETASTFCETIVVEGLLRRADPRQRLAILGEALAGATAITVDIHSRFLFERGVFARRGDRDLSVAELDGLMLDAQAATYGEGLDPAARFAKAWAEKGHYYSSGLSFYNFPYTFGFLFALGLYARASADPTAFMTRYDALLASTGMDDVAGLARGMDIDIEDGSFWRSGLGIVADRVDEYAAAAEESTT